MRSLLLPALLLAAALAGCDADDAPEPDATPLVGEADVERFRTDLFLRTTELDADIAEMEAEAAAQDSAGQVAYDAVLTRLRAERRSLQTRLDSLRPLPQATFDTTTAAIQAQSDRLERAIDGGRFLALAEPGALRARARDALARDAARLDGVRREALADTLRRPLVARIDSLFADRDRFLTQLDTTTVEDDPEAFARLRDLTARRVLAFRDSSLAVVPDTTRTSLRDEVERRRSGGEREPAAGGS